MKRVVVGLLVLCVMLMGATAMAEGAQVSVVDGLGRTVVIDGAPETVVSLTPANTEVLFALGAGDSVVGVDSSSNHPAEVASVENIVGDYSGPNVELIVQLMPDVVFASTTLQSDVIGQMESLGLTVVCNDPTSYQEIEKGIALIAQVMGVDAQAVTGPMKEKEAEILAAAETAKGKKVYFALSFGEYGNWTAGPGTFINDMIEMLGGVNVAKDAQVSWPEYSMEQLILNDPDLILVSAYGGDESIAEALKQADGYKDLRAVKEGKVYAVDADITSRPGPRIAEALKVFAEAMSAE